MGEHGALRHTRRSSGVLQGGHRIAGHALQIGLQFLRGRGVLALRDGFAEWGVLHRDFRQRPIPHLLHQTDHAGDYRREELTDAGRNHGSNLGVGQDSV